MALALPEHIVIVRLPAELDPFGRNWQGELNGHFGECPSKDDAVSLLQIELVPGGKDRSVTSSSRLEYIHRVAHYKLNYQPRLASDAFRIGLEKVIPHEWLRMFSEVELQVCQPLR